jgi:prolyl-tRNA synthetase
MRYTKLFGKTLRDTPRDATLSSHKLLYQAGFIRESTAGRYYFLPLGMRVHDKIKQIIKQEMDATGAQEMVTPVLHPKSLWEETNRTTSVGFELMSIKDRNEMEFVLGGTAEEMLVDLIRKFQVSYKDLPVNLYQFSTKFRDEMRARGGLLRLREFVMKDAYSFDATEEAFKKEYKKMWETYTKIYSRLGLKTIVVESDNGYIGGDYCHEFVVESEAGESKFFMTDDGKYAAHEEVTKFKVENKNIDEKEAPLEEVEAIRGNSMVEGEKLHGKPLWQHIKNVVYVDETGRFVMGVIRGDLDVNEIKLAHAAKAYTLRSATEEEIRQQLGSEPGFLSPVGIHNHMKIDTGKILIVGDRSLRTIKNAISGANKKHKDLININRERDYMPDIEADIALAKAGYMSESDQKLIERRGIEVGNIFQLGFHYSSKMTGATFTDENGEKKPYYMGCYGIGLARTLATIVEVHHDDRGIVWPEAIAPFQVHLIDIQAAEKGEEIYKALTAQGVEVLWDDRDVRAGEKFADADLIGIPIRLVVSAKTGDKIELKKRAEKETTLVNFDEVLAHITHH